MMKYKYELRQVEAWRDGESWSYNNSFHIADYAVSESADGKRAFLRAMHKNGFVCKRGMTRVETDGSMFELVNRKDGEPLMAAIPMF